MNSEKLLKCFLLLIAASFAGNVWAGRHGHVRLGVVVGAPIYSSWYHPYPYYRPYYYPSPYYYYPPYSPVIIERSPPVYIEQSSPVPAQAPQVAPTNYWYYCEASKGYYPYVNACPTGWQKVLPQPPSAP